MAMDDRDYYREHWAKKEGHVERSRMRMPMRELERLERRERQAASQPKRDVNWVAVLLAVLLLLLFVVKLSHLAHK